MRFAKYEGLGNDFLLIDDPLVARAIDAERARALCDRHLGVGADGVLLTGVDERGPFMEVYNADGSVPEMCGNGLRCAALHLRRRGLVDAVFEVRTAAGPHGCAVDDDGLVEVQMRPASLAPESLPLASDHPWRDETIAVDGHDGAVHLTAVSMGNPHAVTFDELPEAARRTLGPRLEVDARFPERVNVGFARPFPGGLDLEVWERGVGWTRACGTGACAAAVAAVETGRARRGEPLAVRLPGGTLKITVGAEGEPVRMKGPARHVFSGQLKG